MRTLLKTIILSSLCLIATWSVAASFIVKKIEIDGLQRVSRTTLLSYLPVKQGHELETAETAKIIKTLYETGFFTNVQLAKDAQTLIIKLQERPTISDITITGNKEIPKEKLDDALKKLGLEKGRFLNHATLQQVKQALRNQYYSTGRYNVRIDVQQTKQSRNRVAISIQISEGAVAKVTGIRIIGVQHYAESKLLSQLHLQESGILTFFTRKDQYSAEKLQQSAQDIQNFYLNRGYINVKVNANQVAITPNREHIYLTFKITEGQQYKFSGYKLSGHLVGAAEVLHKAVNIKQGEIFSRQAVLAANKIMIRRLGDRGYAFANIIPRPQIDKKTRTVLINFDVQPGRKYYIRRIHFSGNATTSELALRNQLYQIEGSLFSAQKIQDSIAQLRQDKYLDPTKPPQIHPVKVPGSNDLLDLDVAIAEKLSAEFQLSLGYSQVYGLLLSTGVTQNNFLGTGKTVGFNINWSRYHKAFSLSYLNPYYLPSGVSRSISIYGQNTDASALNISSYSVDRYGVNVGYGFPLSIHSRLSLGYGFASTRLIIPANAPKEISRFQGRQFQQLLLTAGWSRDTTDVPFYTTKGSQQSLGLTVSTPIYQNALQYFTLTYTNQWYHPLSQNFILHTYGVGGYGNGYGGQSELPFFVNYYAGGVGTQGLNRAYVPYSLGPRTQNGQEILGGNLLMSGSVSIIFPHLFRTPTVRTSIFLDGGNVFNANRNRTDGGFALNNIRYSYGAQLEWWTPLGVPLIFSLARPINSKPGDQLDTFQFTIGTVL